MSSSGILAFLEARYDQLEAKARAATPGPWWHNPGKQWLGPDEFERYDTTKGEEFVGYGGPSPFTGCVAATGPADHPQSMADAEHIAANNPRFVLDDVASKRLLLDLHKECTAQCYVVRVLAFPFAGHPQFHDEWRVT